MATRSTLDMNEAMETLTQSRPVFHSESDFKHALSWQIQQDHPSVRIRQEVGNLIQEPERRYMDVWLPDSGTAIELKYLTTRGVIVHGDEEFRLRDQSAQDTRRYDFCLDIARLEGIVRSGKAADGYAFLVTNDHLYWNPPRKTDANDSDSVIHEEREITGTLAWSPRASPGTTKGRETPVEISGRYLSQWRDYSYPQGRGNTRFRYLLMRVSPSGL